MSFGLSDFPTLSYFQEDDPWWITGQEPPIIDEETGANSPSHDVSSGQSILVTQLSLSYFDHAGGLGRR